VARRSLNAFSLSFLDVMACGLGATVLFLMIISTQVRDRAEAANDELVALAAELERQVADAEERLAAARQRKDQPAVPVANEIARLERLIAELQASVQKQDQTSLARRESVEQLRADVQRLQEARARLANTEPRDTTGDRARAFVGQGNRQYVTGMRMGGRRVLFLVDGSASMLGRTYADVVRYRAMPDSRRRQAPKWQQAVASADWLATRVNPGVQFQVYVFSESVRSVVPGTEGEWLDVGDGEGLDRAMTALRQVVPGGGTSLQKAFRAARELKPAPDNIFLLTDGLPTQGESAPDPPENVPPNKRVAFFERALRELPPRVPINTLLFPMDGDPDAAYAYWELAQRTRGSLLAPSRDWP
jgi:Mg-chelatase subunit ChlD